MLYLVIDFCNRFKRCKDQNFRQKNDRDLDPLLNLIADPASIVKKGSRS